MTGQERFLHTCAVETIQQRGKIDKGAFLQKKKDYFIPPLKPQSSASFQVECPSESHEPANLLQCPYWLFSFIYVGIFSNNQCKWVSHLCSLEVFHRHYLKMSYLIFSSDKCQPGKMDRPLKWHKTEILATQEKKSRTFQKIFPIRSTETSKLTFFAKVRMFFIFGIFSKRQKSLKKNHLCTSFLPS